MNAASQREAEVTGRNVALYPTAADAALSAIRMADASELLAKLLLRAPALAVKIESRRFGSLLPGVYITAGTVVGWQRWVDLLAPRTDADAGAVANNGVATMSYTTRISGVRWMVRWERPS